MNKLGKGKFRGFSAGSHPKGQVHPIALDLLQHLGYPTDGLRSKSWTELRETPNSRTSTSCLRSVIRPLASYALPGRASR